MTPEEKLKNLKEKCEKAGFRYALGKFEEETPPPHLVATIRDTDNFMADNKTYFSPIPIKLDHTYITKSIEEQNKIENEILGDIAWNKTEETYSQDEEVWQVSYFFEI
jgi:hypothetical protein